MYASPVTRMTSQPSQPSSSISARVVGRNGAIPNRWAQYGRYENRPRGAVIEQRLAHRGPARRRPGRAVGHDPPPGGPDPLVPPGPPGAPEPPAGPDRASRSRDSAS